MLNRRHHRKPQFPDPQLLPPAVRATLPPWRSTADQLDPVASVKFFLPDTDWTWYVVEYDGEDACFGLVSGQEMEAGYFSLDELQTLRSPLLGLPVERDLSFKPTCLSALRRLHHAYTSQEDLRL